MMSPNSLILIGLKRDNEKSETHEKVTCDDNKMIVTELLTSTIDNLLEDKCESDTVETLAESSEIITKEEYQKSEAKNSSIFLFGTGFGSWGQVDDSGFKDICSDDMDTSSDADGNESDPILVWSQDEDSQSDVPSLSVTDLDQVDGECDMSEDCEEKEDTKVLSPLSPPGRSSDSDSPPWFLSDSDSKESKELSNEEDEEISPYKIKTCDITLEKIETTEDLPFPKKSPKRSPQKIEKKSPEKVEKTSPKKVEKISPQKVERSDSEPDYVELDSDSEEESEPDKMSKTDIELVPRVDKSEDDDIVEINVDDDEEDVIVRSIPDNEQCEDCGLRGSLISLFNPGEGASQAEIVRDSRVSPLEWEEAKRKEVSYVVRNITIYDRNGHMVSVDQVRKKARYPSTLFTIIRKYSDHVPYLIYNAAALTIVVSGFNFILFTIIWII